MGLDSVCLVLAIEEEFGVDIPHPDAEKMHTVGDVFDWLKMHFASAEPGLDEEIWRRLVQVFCRQLNVLEEDVKPESSITRDLGVD